MALDKEIEFQDIQGLKDYVKKTSEEQGYFISIKRSKRTKVWIKCDLGGCYQPNSRPIQRRTGSRLIGCPFEVIGEFIKDRGIWKIVCAKEEHSHSPSENGHGHSIARRLPKDQKARVRELAENGIRVADILNVLRSEFNNTICSAQEVHNELAAARIDELSGRTPIQVLYEKLLQEDFECSLSVNANGSIERLFFVHQVCIDMCRRWGYVFIMDCTYKTNKFGLPLLNIVGITATYHSFNAGFCFLRQETKVDYQWALNEFKMKCSVSPKAIVTDRELALMNALSEVFPSTKNILCIWHINKNLVAKCKHFFGTEDWENFLNDWNSCIYAANERLFKAAWSFFCTKYSAYHQVINYISEHWMPYQDRFINCYTAKVLNFGTTSSSRGEGSHFVLKRYLKISHLDLLSVFKNLKLMLQNQFVELAKKLEEASLKVYHRHKVKFLSQIIQKISAFALDKIVNQYEAIDESTRNEICGGLFQSTYGLPCKHRIQFLIDQNQHITLEMIHPQWKLKEEIDLELPFQSDTVSPKSRIVSKVLDRLQNLDAAQVPTFLSQLERLTDTPVAPISNPDYVTKKRGRPTGAVNKISKRRDKSAFEYVEGRICGKCGKAGHNFRTCAK
jgi:hypothetical protein